MNEEINKSSHQQMYL